MTATQTLFIAACALVWLPLVVAFIAIFRSSRAQNNAASRSVRPYSPPCDCGPNVLCATHVAAARARVQSQRQKAGAR